MIEAFDTARTALLATIEELEHRLAEARSVVARLMAEKSVAESELKGFDRAHELLAEKAKTPEPAKRKRNNVRGVVSELLASFNADEWAAEEWLVNEAARFGVGPYAVHTYLLRAVKAKKMERNGERYRLPRRNPSEFASQPPAQDAAQ